MGESVGIDINIEIDIEIVIYIYIHLDINIKKETDISNAITFQCGSNNFKGKLLLRSVELVKLIHGP